MKLTSEITQIIVSIIGAIGLIMKTVLEYYFKKESSDNNPKVKRIKQIIKEKPRFYKGVNWIITIIFILLLVFGSSQIYHTHFVAPNVSIIFPRDMQSVSDVINIEGKCRNIDEKAQLIWIAIYSYTDNKYFFHKSAAAIDYSSHKWTNHQTVIGTSYDKGGKSEILVMLVDINSDAFMEIKKNTEDLSSHGLDKLPDKCYVLNKINVFIK